MDFAIVRSSGFDCIVFELDMEFIQGINYVLCYECVKKIIKYNDTNNFYSCDKDIHCRILTGNIMNMSCLDCII